MITGPFTRMLLCMTMITLITCDQYYLRTASGGYKLRCYQKYESIIRLKDYDASCSETNDIEACLLFFDPENVRTHWNQWLCLSLKQSEFGGFNIKNFKYTKTMASTPDLKGQEYSLQSYFLKWRNDDFYPMCSP